MYPTAACVTVNADGVDEARYLERALTACGTVVYDFGEHDEEQLPELPAPLAVEFG